MIVIVPLLPALHCRPAPRTVVPQTFGAVVDSAPQPAGAVASKDLVARVRDKCNSLLSQQAESTSARLVAAPDVDAMVAKAASEAAADAALLIDVDALSPDRFEYLNHVAPAAAARTAGLHSADLAPPSLRRRVSCLWLAIRPRSHWGKCTNDAPASGPR